LFPYRRRTAPVELPICSCPGKGKNRSRKRAVSHFRLSCPRKGRRSSSCLRFASSTASQQQTVVKVYGVFVSPWKSTACSPCSRFTRSKAGTVGRSLRHSCFGRKRSNKNKQSCLHLIDAQLYIVRVTPCWNNSAFLQPPSASNAARKQSSVWDSSAANAETASGIQADCSDCFHIKK